MLKASSLIYALAVALLIAALSSSFILLSYLFNVQTLRMDERARESRNTLSGLYLMLGEDAPGQQATEVDLYGDGSDNISVRRYPWGVFEVAVAQTLTRNVAERAVLMGRKPGPDSDYALYLSDRNRALSVCGKTLVRGKAYLPEAMVKRAYIEGKSFDGQRLIDGVTSKSDKAVKPPDTDALGELDRQMTERFSTEDSLYIFADNQPILNMHQSFTAPPRVITGTSIVVGDVDLLGHIVIQADRKISVLRSAHLKQVLLIAPIIEIESGFNGSLQALATEDIIVGEDCQLAYPSALVLRSQKTGKESSEVRMEKNASVGGVIFVMPRERNSRTLVVLGEETTLTGQVYVQGNAQVQGTIHGNLTVDELILKTPSSVYQNHLLDAVIDRESLSDFYVGAALWPDAAEKKWVQWLE
ncbi:MAG: hypothetical protein KDD36_01500 [Flavobacteriales bacterium]|nr:hypothetical protein [Flavobacteriales bacterium]